MFFWLDYGEPLSGKKGLMAYLSLVHCTLPKRRPSVGEDTISEAENLWEGVNRVSIFEELVQ